MLVIYRILFLTTDTPHPLYDRFFLWLSPVRAVTHIIICQGKGEDNSSISYISTFQDKPPPRFLKEIVEHIVRARYLVHYHAPMGIPVQAEKRPLLKKCQQQIYPGRVPLLIIMIEMCAL